MIPSPRGYWTRHLAHWVSWTLIRALSRSTTLKILIKGHSRALTGMMSCRTSLSRALRSVKLPLQSSYVTSDLPKYPSRFFCRSLVSTSE